MGQLTWIVVLPLLGFLVNGLIGRRFGPRFVSVVGCGLPLAAFAIVVMCFINLGTRDGALIETVYRWATIGDRTFPLDDAIAAQAHMKANQHFGKIALVM